MFTQESLAVTNAQALRFFFERLRDITVDGGNAEIVYNASILAHYSTLSTASSSPCIATPLDLCTIFDVFVMDRSQHHDPEIMETAAAQCLLLTGFFGEQLKRRHNVEWYASLGADFYDHAAQHCRDNPRRQMLGRMSVNFWFWRRQQARLAQDFRDSPYLIRPT